MRNPIAVSSLLLSGCLGLSMDQEVGKPPGLPENEPRFHERLRQISSTYESFGRVDDELRWAPWLCRQPMPSRTRFSKSEDAESHGRKLYYVFAADREGYLRRPGTTPEAVGQAVVKEAWIAKEVPLDTPMDPRANPVRYVKQGDRLFHAESKAALFIMYRLDPATPGTDAGWVYGTVSADQTITSAGRVSSCMGCHQSAPAGRLFGIDYQGL
jgi:hypothetical protein